jgi:cupin 2 domain-containing protein
MSEKFIAGNLLSALPPAGREEHFAVLHAAAGGRVERIVSHGQASPAGFWYEQADDEWVTVVAGEAALEFGDGRNVCMRAGDWLLLPAGCRHRVARTASPTVWLAVHLATTTGGGAPAVR